MAAVALSVRTRGQLAAAQTRKHRSRRSRDGIRRTSSSVSSPGQDTGLHPAFRTYAQSVRDVGIVFGVRRDLGRW